MGLASQLAAAASAAGSAAIDSQKYNTPAVPPMNNPFTTTQGYTNPLQQQAAGYLNNLPQQPPTNSQYGEPAQPQPGYGLPPPSSPNVNFNAYGATPFNSPNNTNRSQSGPYSSIVFEKLRMAVQAKGLDAFYPVNRLQQVASRAAAVDYTALASRWRMPVEIALELVPLALYDIVVYADDSGSMQFAENGSRIDDLKEILSKVSEVATLFDEDGILIRFMNSNAAGNGIKSPADAEALLKNISFDGTTPLGSALDAKVVKPLFVNNLRNLQKPILVIAITDGEPSEDPGIIKRVIVEANETARRSRYGSGAIAFEFAQVGKDAKAQQFLASLDNDARVGHMIDATSYYELEAEEFKRKGMTLTPSLWLIKLMVGAIDPDKDRHD